MLKDEERIRVSTRGDDLRGRYRPPQRAYHVLAPLRIAPPRRRRGPLLAVVAALVVVAAGGFVASRVWLEPGVDGALAGASSGDGADAAPLVGARIMAWT